MDVDAEKSELYLVDTDQSTRGMQGLLYNNKQRGREKQRLIVKLLPQETFQESSFCSSKANYCPRPKQ